VSGAAEVGAGPWPTASDYMAAVQDPAASFHHPAVDGLRLRPGLMGLPAAATGQNAIVFDADGPNGRTALRCFTSIPARGDDVYRRLEAMDLPDVIVPVAWRDRALEVNCTRWPVVTMPWVAGDPLQRWVGDNLHLPARIAALADAWVEACRLLVACGIAHGDLQHGNVLVTSSGQLRIIDFDGVLLFDPALGTHLTAAPTEVGHPDYQHPQRIEDGHVSRYVDTFSALLIHTTLRALITDPGLWSHHAGENLVLAQRDLFEPESSEVFSRMRRSDDPVVVRGADLLARWCRSGVAANLTLGDVLGVASSRGAAAGAAGGVAIEEGSYRSRAAEREARALASAPVAAWTAGQRPERVPVGSSQHAQYRATDGRDAASAAADPDAGTAVRSPREVEGLSDRTLRTIVLPAVLGLGVGALLLVIATVSGVAGRFLPTTVEAALPPMLEVGSCFVVDEGGRVLPQRCSALNDGRVVAQVADPESCELLDPDGVVPFVVIEGRVFCLEDR